MRYPKKVIRRNIRARKLLDVVHDGYKNEWDKIPDRIIKECIEIEMLDLERFRFCQFPLGKGVRNWFVHKKI